MASSLAGQTVVVVRTSEVTFPTGQLVTVGLQDVIVYVVVTRIVDVTYPGSDSGTNCVEVGLEPGFSVSVTGQTVVEMAMISVVTWPLPGQLVTVGAHEVIVYVRVE